MTEDNTASHAEETLQALHTALVKVLDTAPVIPARVRLNLNGAELDVSWHEPGRPALPAVPTDRVPEPEMLIQDGADADPHVVRAPLVGTFYRAPEPGSAPFVEVSGVIRCGQQLGIIEAMELMNAVEADRDGRVVEILVADGTSVEYDQPLALIDPT
jgi:acetyl-CoA carboxylase biotin carboxyl carrier protein